MNDWVVETPSFEENLMNNRVVMLNQVGVKRVVEIIKEKDKEIERLKQDNEYLNKVNIELSNRNSKAMKYINEKENNDDNWIDYELLIEPLVLIDILRGSDKE